MQGLCPFFLLFLRLFLGSLVSWLVIRTPPRLWLGPIRDDPKSCLVNDCLAQSARTLIRRTQNPAPCPKNTVQTLSRLPERVPFQMEISDFQEKVLLSQPQIITARLKAQVASSAGENPRKANYQWKGSTP